MHKFTNLENLRKEWVSHHPEKGKKIIGQQKNISNHQDIFNQSLLAFVCYIYLSAKVSSYK